MKVCIYIKNNNINALKIIIQSLKSAGCHTDDIILISDNCKVSSLTYDAIFNVPKLQCKTIKDLLIYKNDDPIYSDNYLILVENIEITKSTLPLAHQCKTTGLQLFYKEQLIAMVTPNLEDLEFFTKPISTKEDSSYSLLKDNLQLNAYSKPMDILSFNELQILLYVESST